MLFCTIRIGGGGGRGGGGIILGGIVYRKQIPISTLWYCCEYVYIVTAVMSYIL